MSFLTVRGSTLWASAFFLCFATSCSEPQRDVRSIVAYSPEVVCITSPQKLIQAFGDAATPSDESLPLGLCLPELFDLHFLNTGISGSKDWVVFGEKELTSFGLIVPIHLADSLSSYLHKEYGAVQIHDGGIKSLQINDDCTPLQLLWDDQNLIILTRLLDVDRAVASHTPEKHNWPQDDGNETIHGWVSPRLFITHEDTLFWSIESEKGGISFQMGVEKGASRPKSAEESTPKFSLNTHLPVDAWDSIPYLRSPSIQGYWSAIKSVWTGQLSLQYKGKGTHEKIITTYDYDDDFNQITLEKRILKTYDKLQLQARLKSPDDATHTFDYAKKESLITKSPPYETVGSPVPLRVHQSENLLCLSSSYDTSSCEDLPYGPWIKMETSCGEVYEELIRPHLSKKETKMLDAVIGTLQKVDLQIDAPGQLRCTIHYKNRKEQGATQTLDLVRKVIFQGMGQNPS